MSSGAVGGDGASGRQRPAVVLVAVDEAVLEALVVAATGRADADEVTPPATPPGGPTAEGLAAGWSPQRVAWLRSFHRDRRAGLDGPAQEATWAVLVDAGVVGSVRLASASAPGTLETGVWLVRDVRGRGVGHAVMARVLERAAASGAARVLARTTAGNLGALAVLRRAGFTLAAGADGSVEAVREV